MLRVGETSTIKFNVDINGTGAPPEVRVVLNLGAHELGFKCTKEGTEWHAEVKIPADTVPGQYDMRVEVAINNRLFVPVKRKVEVGGPEIQVAATMEAEPIPVKQPTPVPPAPPVVPPPSPPLPVEPPAPPQVVQPKMEEAKVVERVVEKPVEKVIEKKAPPVTVNLKPKPAPVKVEPLLKSFAPPAKDAVPRPVPPAPKKVVAAKPPPAPAKKVPLNIPPQNIKFTGKVEPVRSKPKVVTPQPVQESGPIRISITDIVEESNKRFPDIEKSASYQSPIAPVKAFTINPGAPVTLVKGEVVYE